MTYEVMPPGWIGKHGWDFWHDYHAGTWEPETQQTIYEFVKPGTTYVDIGAWIGPTVKWAAGVAGKVIAIEPDPVAFDCLVHNTSHLLNVTRVHGAIADHTGTVLLLPHNAGFGASMSRLDAPNLPAATWQAEGYEVQCWTLPDFFAEHEIEDCSLVKMDIEGGESEILDVVAPFLAERKIPLHVSLHETWWSRPVDREWFKGFSEVRGIWSGFEPILAVP